MNRKDLLENAIIHTCKDRNKEYGEPLDNLGDCAILWTAYLTAKYSSDKPVSLTAEDIAYLNILQKIARTFRGTPKADTYEDMAAYSAIAGECRIAHSNKSVPRQSPAEAQIQAIIEKALK